MLDERTYRIVLYISIALLIASVALATIQRYIASIFSLLSGLALLAFLAEKHR